MMRHSRAPALAHNRRVRDAFGVANVYDVPDNVVRVFLERIIGRAVKVAARSIVIDAESAADVEITKFVSKLCELCVISRALRAPRVLIVEMSGTCEPTWKWTSLRQCASPASFSISTRSDQIRRVEAELGVLAAARRPFTSSLCCIRRARIPIQGSTPTSLDARMICSTSSSFSATMTTGFA